MKKHTLMVPVLITILLISAPHSAFAYSIKGWGLRTFDSGDFPITNAVAVAAGSGYSLVLKSDGSIVGWGLNNYGQAIPPDGNDFAAIAAGVGYSLALKSDGSIVGWGWNYSGQVTPPAGNDYVAIAAGETHSLALKSDGSIVGWGSNTYGLASPPAGNNYFSIAAGRSHSLALKSDGTIVGWGANFAGQATPPTGNNYVAIAAGDSYSLALKSDGTIVGWGNSFAGEATPPAGNNYVAIAAGCWHSLALRNTPPVADARPDQIVYADPNNKAIVTLDGSASFDDDNDSLTYLWTWTIDGNDFTCTEPNFTVELPAGQYSFELTVNDGLDDSKPNDVNVTVVPPLKAQLEVMPNVINRAGSYSGRQSPGCLKDNCIAIG